MSDKQFQRCTGYTEESYAFLSIIC